MSTFTEIATEVLAEHVLCGDEEGPWECVSMLDHETCGAEVPEFFEDDFGLELWHHAHVAEVLAERLGVTERVEIGWHDDQSPLITRIGPDGNYITPPTHWRALTKFEHVGDWEACDE